MLQNSRYENENGSDLQIDIGIVSEVELKLSNF